MSTATASDDPQQIESKSGPQADDTKLQNELNSYKKLLDSKKEHLNKSKKRERKAKDKNKQLVTELKDTKQKCNELQARVLRLEQQLKPLSERDKARQTLKQRAERHAPYKDLNKQLASARSELKKSLFVLQAVMNGLDTLHEEAGAPLGGTPGDEGGTPGDEGGTPGDEGVGFEERDDETKTNAGNGPAPVTVTAAPTSSEFLKAYEYIYGHVDFSDINHLKQFVLKYRVFINGLSRGGVGYLQTSMQNIAVALDKFNNSTFIKEPSKVGELQTQHELLGRFNLFLDPKHNCY